MYSHVEIAADRRLIKNAVHPSFVEVKAAGTLLLHTQARLTSLCGAAGVEPVFLSEIMEQIGCVQRLLRLAVHEYELAVCDSALWEDVAFAEAAETERLIGSILESLKGGCDSPARQLALSEYMRLTDHAALPLLRRMKDELDQERGQV